jgi:hypothetical protein
LLKGLSNSDKPLSSAVRIVFRQVAGWQAHHQLQGDNTDVLYSLYLEAIKLVPVDSFCEGLVD